MYVLVYRECRCVDMCCYSTSCSLYLCTPYDHRIALRAPRRLHRRVHHAPLRAPRPPCVHHAHPACTTFTMSAPCPLCVRGLPPACMPHGPAHCGPHFGRLLSRSSCICQWRKKISLLDGGGGLESSQDISLGSWEDIYPFVIQV